MSFIRQISHQNRNYIYDDSKSDIEKFRIENDIKVPNFLKKYFTISDNSVDAVIDNFLYAAHPYELNDPFDCYQHLIDDTKVIRDYYDELVGKLGFEKDLYDQRLTLGENYTTLLYIAIFLGCGIISMTDSENENPILWANYADKHKGFSVTYKREAIKACGPFPVNYVKNLEKKYDHQNFQALLPYWTTIKSEYWQNEQEWRFLHISNKLMYVPGIHDDKTIKEIYKKNRRLYFENRESITEVTLGKYFFDEKRPLRNDQNEWEFDLTKEEINRELKIKLLHHLAEYKIPLCVLFEDKNAIKFTAMRVDYKYFPEKQILKIKDPM